MDRWLDKHAESMLAMLAFLGFVFWCVTMVGCRTVYVNSVHNQQTGGAVETVLRDNAAESDVQQGKTVTTEAQLPIEEIADVATPEEAVVDAVVDAVADGEEESGE